MSLRDFFIVIRPNPDLVGQVKIKAEDIDYASLERDEMKLRAAKEYIRERGIKPKPIYSSKAREAA